MRVCQAAAWQLQEVVGSRRTLCQWISTASLLCSPFVVSPPVLSGSTATANGFNQRSSHLLSWYQNLVVSASALCLPSRLAMQRRAKYIANRGCPTARNVRLTVATPVLCLVLHSHCCMKCDLGGIRNLPKILNWGSGVEREGLSVVKRHDSLSFPLWVLHGELNFGSNLVPPRSHFWSASIDFPSMARDSYPFCEPNPSLTLRRQVTAVWIVLTTIVSGSVHVLGDAITGLFALLY